MIFVNIKQELIDWVCGDDTGLSSKAIFQHMTTGRCGGSYPHDPADLGRCLRLLNIAPDWENRIGEMAKYGQEWAALSSMWQELKKLYLDESGGLVPTRRSATRTYDAMLKCRGVA